MSNISTLSIKPGKLFFQILAAETLIIAVLLVVQTRMALAHDEADWPLTIFSFANLAATGAFSIVAAFRESRESALRRLLLLTGAMFILNPVLQLSLPEEAIDLDDLTVLFSWCLGILTMTFVLTRERGGPTVTGLFIAGLTLQGAAILLDASFGDFLFPDQPIGIVDWTYVTATSLSILAYLLGFQLFVFGRKGWPETVGRNLHREAYHGAGRLVSIVSSQIAFAVFRLRRPRATFADYYADTLAKRLARGGSHKTLGRKHFLAGEERSADDENRGRRQFELLKSLGIAPDHHCIEYGCGSLRVGRHFIDYLQPGRYMGLDIVSQFYEDGVRLLRKGTMESKRPELLVIGDEGLSRAQTFDADFIVSIAVLKHIPPDELGIFFKRLASIMGERTVLAIEFEQGRNSRRTGANNWSYDFSFLAEELLKAAPQLEIWNESPGYRSKVLLIAQATQRS